jgi:hypothetical protein
MTTFLIILVVFILLVVWSKLDAKQRIISQAKKRIELEEIEIEERWKERSATRTNEVVLEQYPAKVKKLVDELIEAGRKYPPDGQSSSHYLNTGRSRAREIGILLEKEGGNNLMLIAHAKVSSILGGTAARELEVAWDGVGEWMG